MINNNTLKAHTRKNRIKESTGYQIFTVVNTIIMILISAATLYPFLYLVSQSFTSDKAIIAGHTSLIPEGFNVDTYKYILSKGEFLMFYKNTIVYTLIGTVSSLLFSAMLADKKKFGDRIRFVLLEGPGRATVALAAPDLGLAIGAGTDVAIDAAGAVLVNSRLSDVVAALRLGRATLRNIRENLFWAFVYNVLLIPLAAGALYPLFGWKMHPDLGALAMSLSSLCVVLNALRLNRFRP